MRTVHSKLTIFMVAITLFFFAGGCAGPNYQIPTAYHQPQTFTSFLNQVGEAGMAFSRGYMGDFDTGAGVADLLTLLEGCVIVANDGQPLGVITQNEFAANSILNQFGKYGNKFSSTSIFNEFGKYGGEFSRLSPFNEFTRTPPQIISRDGKLVAYLTKNKFMTPAVDPHLLIGLLKAEK